MHPGLTSVQPAAGPRDSSLLWLPRVVLGAHFVRFYLHREQPFSKCGPQSGGVTREVVRDANFYKILKA